MRVVVLSFGQRSGLYDTFSALLGSSYSATDIDNMVCGMIVINVLAQPQLQPISD
jgi:hypothetical protein